MLSLSRLVWLLPMAALGAALLDMPYGYYELLRVLVFCAAAYLAFESQKHGNLAWAWVLAGTAIIYNPLIKLALGREIWELVNIATIILFAAHLASVARSWDRASRSGY